MRILIFDTRCDMLMVGRFGVREQVNPSLITLIFSIVDDKIACLPQYRKSCRVRTIGDFIIWIGEHLIVCMCE